MDTGIIAILSRRITAYKKKQGIEFLKNPLSEQVPQSTDKTEESVEEFFDEEDSSDEEPPISDN
ncbi:MAG: hypothetical protein HFH87_14720 [Lachnospiraceae bacterium]|nr:hypothetical protein [Lachnospiraceae bacterium]